MKPIRDLELKPKWDIAENELNKKYHNAKEILEALKLLYTLFNGDSVIWLANLYDHKTGGFYYSNSGRDNDGFLPDLESTAQALSFIRGSGMVADFNRDVKTAMPEWFGKDIVAFAKGLQDPQNGYFYHPQWGKEKTDKNLARRGRDLFQAQRIFEIFRSAPTYDMPSGICGDGITADGRSVNPHIGTISTNCGATESKAEPPVADNLKSKEKFLNYLSELDINKDPYYYGNLLESQSSQIVARDKTLELQGADYRLCDILEEWLTSHQNTDTGSWRLDNIVNYDAINGILKITGTYTRINKKVPFAEKALASAIEATLLNDDIRHVCDVLNPWYSITLLLNNVKNYSTDSLDIEPLMKRLADKAPEAILATKKKLEKLLRNDGSFGYMPERTAPCSQWMPVALDNTKEGDVNATYIANLCIADHIFCNLGIQLIPVCTPSDREVFISILESKR